MFAVYHIHFMRNVIDQYPEIYLDELQQWMRYFTGISISISAIHTYLKKMGMSLQKVGWKIEAHLSIHFFW